MITNLIPKWLPFYYSLFAFKLALLASFKVNIDILIDILIVYYLKVLKFLFMSNSLSKVLACELYKLTKKINVLFRL